MRKWFKLLNNTLTVFAFKLPLPLRATYTYLLGWIKAAATLLSARHILFYRLPTQSGEINGDIGYLGFSTNLSFVAHQVGHAGLETLPQWEISWWQVQSAIQRAQKDCDILVIELPQRALRRLNLTEGIFTLPWLRWRIQTNCPWEQIEARFHKDAHRDWHKSEKITCIISRQEEDLRHFYTHLYRPYIIQRFGPQAEPSSLAELHHYLQHGWLVLAKFQDEIVGGELCYTNGQVIYDHVGATKPGLDRRTQGGVTATNFVYMIQTAWQQGYTALDLGFSRPLLDDGVGRYKRKWGAEVFADFSQNWGLWIKVGRDAAKAQVFLAQHPWIWIDKPGRLNGLVVINQAKAPLNLLEINKICKRLWTPGLHSIVVYASKGFASNVNLSRGPIPELGPAMEWTPNTETTV